MKYDSVTNPPLRSDERIQAENDYKYYTQRGRKCEYPGCKEPVRYTKDEPYCGAHEPKGNTKRSQERYLRGPATIPLPSLYAYRIRQFSSARELAKRAGVARKTVEHLESGRRQATLPTAEKLARALGVSVEALKGEGKPAVIRPNVRQQYPEELPIGREGAGM